MAISTYSKFYYDIEVGTDNNIFQFNEGSGDLTVTMGLGIYSLEGLALELQQELNAVGTLTYNVVVNRANRTYDISASGSFDILISSGSSSGIGIYSLIGFTGSVDLTGQTSYTSDSSIGKSYTTQFWPQNYVGPDERKEKGSASVNVSANGQVEVISFGDVRFVEMDLLFINSGILIAKPFRYSATGKEDAIDFLTEATKRGPIEFMPDSNNEADFYEVILESTPEDSNGTKFKLKEETGKNLPNVYKTGTLVFRIVE